MKHKNAVHDINMILKETFLPYVCWDSNVGISLFNFQKYLSLYVIYQLNRHFTKFQLQILLFSKYCYNFCESFEE